MSLPRQMMSHPQNVAELCVFSIKGFHLRVYLQGSKMLKMNVVAYWHVLTCVPMFIVLTQTCVNVYMRTLHL